MISASKKNNNDENQLEITKAETDTENSQDIVNADFIASLFNIEEDIQQNLENVAFLIKEYYHKDLEPQFLELSTRLIPLLSPEISKDQELTNYACILFVIFIKSPGICNYYVKHDIHQYLFNYLPNPMAISLFQQLLVFNQHPKHEMIIKSQDTDLQIYDQVFSFLKEKNFLDIILNVLRTTNPDDKLFMSSLMCFGSYSHYDVNNSQVKAYLDNLLSIFLNSETSDNFRFYLFSVFNNFVERSTEYLNYFLGNASFLDIVNSFDHNNVLLCKEFIRFLSICVSEKEDITVQSVNTLMTLIFPYIEEQNPNFTNSIANFFHECAYSIQNITKVTIENNIVQILNEQLNGDFNFETKSDVLRSICSLISVADDESIQYFLENNYLQIVLDFVEPMWRYAGLEMTDALYQFGSYAISHDESLISEIFDSDAFMFIREIYDSIEDYANCREHSLQASVMVLVNLDPNFKDFED